MQMRLLLVEAVLCLLLARAVLWCLPFRMIEWYMQRRARQPQLQGEARSILRNAVRWSILRATVLLPGKTVCFPRAIAAQAMLRRRRVGTTLYYGAVTQAEKGLKSHVWVQDGTSGVIGLRAAHGYKTIARYPDD
jgi:hypothetical protein